MRVLLTGASGFMGRLILEMLNSDDRVEQIYAVSRNQQIPIRLLNDKTSIYQVDIADIDAVSSLFKTIKPTHILHFAGCPLVRGAPSLIINSNITGTQNILECTPEGCRFVFASSVVVYGNMMNYTSCDETDETIPNSVYAASKLAGESLVSVYTEQDRLSGISLRFCAVVGPGTTHGIVFDFIRKLGSTNEYLELIGERPGTIKPYLHYSDALNAISKFAFDSRFNGNVNIATSDPISVEKVAESVMEAIDIKKPMKWLGKMSTWAGDNPQIAVSNRLARDLGWRLTYSDSSCAIKQVVQSL